MIEWETEGLRECENDRTRVRIGEKANGRMRIETNLCEPLRNLSLPVWAHLSGK